MNLRYREIEIKYDAQNVNRRLFKEYLDRIYNVIMHDSVKGHDYYYKNGKNVVRVRSSKDKLEITVKKRLSKNSTKERLEVDLLLNSDFNNTKDVDLFLTNIGFVKILSLYKSADIYYLSNQLEVSMYDVHEVGCKDEPRRIMEVEMAKAIESTTVNRLDRFCSILEGRFDIKKIENKSLWEMYTKHKYAIKK